jgi:hypothetical protein
LLKVSVVKGFAFQAREWLRKRGAVVGLATAGVVILIAGAGASLAVTGVLAAPVISIDSTSTPTATPTPIPVATNVAEVPKPRTRLDALGAGAWTALASPDGIVYRWVGNSIEVTWASECVRGLIAVKIGPPYWGELSRTINDWSAIGGSASTWLCDQPNPGSIATGDVGIGSPAFWKCFNFTHVWIEVGENSPEPGLYKVDIPTSSVARECPPGASTNDPTRGWNMEDGFPVPAPDPSPTTSYPATPVVTPSPTPTPSPTRDPSPATT